MLLTSALFVSIFTVATPPKEAHAANLTVAFYSTVSGPVITSGKSGDVVLVYATGVTPTVADFAACSIAAPVSNIVTQATAMVFASKVYGSFKVGNGPSGPGGAAYTITVTCGGSSDSGVASFTVLPSIIISPPIALRPSGSGTTVVSVTGFGFKSDYSGSCSISDDKATGATFVTTGPPAPTCSISGGAVTGQFTLTSSPDLHSLANAPPAYTITVTGSGQSASAFFGLVGAPEISLNPAFQAGLGPTKAPAGYGTAGTTLQVKITGGGFATGVGTRGCQLTQDIADTLFGATSCSIDSAGTVTASFSVASAGATLVVHTVRVTDPTPAVFDEEKFTVVPSPTLSSPALPHGAAGYEVTLPHNNNFWGDDSTMPSNPDAGPCTISSTPGGLVSSSVFCWIDNSGQLWAGPGITKAYFTVLGTAPNQPGGYQLAVTGLHGDPSALSTAFTVDPAITITGNAYGSPPLGALPGSTITLSGTGFLATDIGCEIAPSAPNDISSSAVTTSSCTLNPATGQISASFVVPSGATFQAGGYQLGVLGLPGHLDSAATAAGAFMVVPRIVLNPQLGPGGTPVALLGSGFSGTGSGACTSIVSTLGALNLPLNPTFGTPPTTAATCTINPIAGSGTVVGAFTVDPAVPNGLYTVTVTNPGGAADSASASFTKGVAVTLTITPFSGPTTTGAVSVTGTFTAADAGTCNSITAPAGSNLFAGAPTPTCTVDSSGALTASFTVNANAQGGIWPVTVVTHSGSVGTGNFVVTPQMTLTPSNGPSSTPVSITGSGFSAADAAAACASTLFSSPTNNLMSGLICSINPSTFQMTGSFTVAAGASPGSYTVTYPSSLGAVTATPTFVKTGGISLSPFTGGAGTSVFITGSGFAAGDWSCSISSSPSSPTLISNPVCTVAGGVVSGSFTVGPGASGAYLVTVKGSTGDVGIASFSANVVPSLTLTPPLGPAGTVVTASGSNFAGSGLCQLTSSPAGLFTSQLCTISGGALTGSGFTVAAGAAVGSYTVTVTTNVASDTSAASFTVPVVLPPSFYLNPSSGLPGAVVAVSGQNYLGNICSLSSVPSGLFASTPTCSISGGTLTGSFTVAAGAPLGSYTVTVTTNISTDTNTAPFTVSASTFAVSPTSGAAGNIVSALGSNYEGTTCGLSSVPSGLFASTPTCSISGGTLTGSFTVASNAPLGNYVVTVTTNVAADTNAAPFTVTAVGAPTFALSSSLGPTGASILVSGQNYAGTTCTLSFAPLAPSLFSSQSCSISAGALSGGFVVASGASGSYTVTIKTNLGETKTASFTPVTGPLTFILTPALGIVGTHVVASGSNFKGTTCTLGVTPSGLFTSQTCSITSGTLTGDFTVASSASAGAIYTVTLTTDVTGETKTAQFTVSSPAVPTFLLSPTSGQWSTGVAISGTNYAGTTCTLSSSPSGLFSSSSCSISAGHLSGGFTVVIGASVGGYTVTVNTDKEQLSAPFTVTSRTGTGSCIIATATFGSEASPAVQYLRNFRDHLALSTKAGSAFMVVFNAWYYSFSPTVAGYIAANDPIRAPIRMILYPLLGLLGVSSFTYSLFSGAPEFAIVMAGLVASSLIGLVYLTPFTFVGMRVLTRRRRISVAKVAKGSLLLLAGALALLAAGEVAGSFPLLAMASSVIVLTCIIAAPTIAALVMTRPRPQ